MLRRHECYDMERTQLPAQQGESWYWSRIHFSGIDRNYHLDRKRFGLSLSWWPWSLSLPESNLERKQSPVFDVEGQSLVDADISLLNANHRPCAGGLALLFNAMLSAEIQASIRSSFGHKNIEHPAQQ